MEPLQELFDLYEAARGMRKPELQEPPPSNVGTPGGGSEDHPVTRDRKKVDAMRLSGAGADKAHEAVHGEVRTDDVDAKGKFAATLGRVQQDNNKSAVYVDHDADHKSIFAKDEEIQAKVTKATVNDLRTPASKEIPDALEPPESIDTQEEMDYNADVEYILKYGR